MEIEAPSFAKITRPKAKGIFPRKRLFRLLDQGKDRPVLWVSGPPGSGKTSLIASYLDARRLRSLWYRVDESDSDIASFFFYLGLAAKKASPRFRKPLPLLTPEYLMGISTFTLRFFENLYGRLNPPFFIIFDNYHSVALGSLLHEVFLNGASIIPEGVKVILISRREPPPVFARLHANDQMEFLEWNELRFTLEESKKIVGLRMPGLRLKETAESELGTGSHLRFIRRSEICTRPQLLLAAEWSELQPSELVRQRAERLLSIHPLKSADSFQLAAALIWAQENPQGLEIACLDQTLRESAHKEGFTIIP